MNSLISVRLASIADAEALSGLNQEFNGGVRRPRPKLLNIYILTVTNVLP